MANIFNRIMNPTAQVEASEIICKEVISEKVKNAYSLQHSKKNGKCVNLYKKQLHKFEIFHYN